jgi:predicted 3-demethylubiquinone-9 3-methyltransferase (glyoxalase superfamily)
MSKITPFLWFDNNADQAIQFYQSVFSNFQTISASRAENGQLFTATIEIEGQQLMLLNGGPEYKFTEAISLFVTCEDQAEVDNFWTKLTADGGQPGQCGWLKDKFGLSWQIVPKQLGELMGDPNPAKSQAVVQAMLKMTKIIVADLQKAHDGN